MISCKWDRRDIWRRYFSLNHANTVSEWYGHSAARWWDPQIRIKIQNTRDSFGAWLVRCRHGCCVDWRRSMIRRWRSGSSFPAPLPDRCHRPRSGRFVWTGRRRRMGIWCMCRHQRLPRRCCSGRLPVVACHRGHKRLERCVYDLARVFWTSLVLVGTLSRCGNVDTTILHYYSIVILCEYKCVCVHNRRKTRTSME